VNPRSVVDLARQPVRVIQTKHPMGVQLWLLVLDELVDCLARFPRVARLEVDQLIGAGRHQIRVEPHMQLTLKTSIHSGDMGENAGDPAATDRGTEKSDKLFIYI